MATLKYKDGNTWQELKLGTDSTTIISTSWPPGSIYINYSALQGSSRPSSSPASLFGGNWSNLKSSSNQAVVMSHNSMGFIVAAAGSSSAGGFPVTSLVLWERLS